MKFSLTIFPDLHYCLIGSFLPGGMPLAAWSTIGIVIAILTLLITTKLPPDLIFLGGLVVLFGSGILEEGDALSGFNSSGMLTVAVLYVVVAGMQQSGGLLWISRHLMGFPKNASQARLRMMVPISGLSAFLNNTPVVAMFIPVVHQWGKKLGISPSQLMIPLSYASIFGGICTLIGTSTNIVVNAEFINYYGGAGLSMFEITKLGLPCALVGIVSLLFLSRQLLPKNKSPERAFEDTRAYTLEVLVAEGGPFVGKKIEAAGLRHLNDVYLAEIVRGDQILTAVSPWEVLRAHDRLIFVGRVDGVRELLQTPGLEAASDQIFKLSSPRHQRCLVEVVVSNTCPLLGKTIRDGRFRDRYHAVVLAVARNGERIRKKIGDIVLQPGDVLLVESHTGFISRQKDSRDFFLVSEIPDSTPLRVNKAWIALLILLSMVAVVTVGWLSMLKAAMIAAVLMVLMGCCSFNQARKSIEWNILLVIAAALGIGRALDKTGAAEAIANGLVGLSGNSPWLALLMVYLTTSLFTEIITNNAAAVLVFPIAMSASQRLEANPLPFVICVMIAASASFATPIGYQTNLMVFGPGGYRFSDYLKIGIPLNLIIAALVVLLAPLIWPF
jgi:di/tricarboxylate transporter